MYVHHPLIQPDLLGFPAMSSYTPLDRLSIGNVDQQPCICPHGSHMHAVDKKRAMGGINNHFPLAGLGSAFVAEPSKDESGRKVSEGNLRNVLDAGLDDELVFPPTSPALPPP